MRVSPFSQREAEFDAVPVEPRQPVQRAGAHRRQPLGAHRLHEIRDLGLGEHRDMAEHVVEDVGLLDIVEAVGGADEIAGREAALREMLEEDVVGDEAGDRDDRPAGAREQPLVELVEIGDAGLRQVQHVEAAEEIGDRPALQQLLLAREERVPDAMLPGREPLPMLGDGPVGRGAGGRRRLPSMIVSVSMGLPHK